MKVVLRTTGPIQSAVNRSYDHQNDDEEESGEVLQEDSTHINN
jgi:hypothetical protein